MNFNELIERAVSHEQAGHIIAKEICDAVTGDDKENAKEAVETLRKCALNRSEDKSDEEYQRANSLDSFLYNYLCLSSRVGDDFYERLKELGARDLVYELWGD